METPVDTTHNKNLRIPVVVSELMFSVSTDLRESAKGCRRSVTEYWELIHPDSFVEDKVL